MLNAERYFLYDDNGNVFLEQDTPIGLECIFSKFENDNIRLSKTFFWRFLKKWRIITTDSTTHNVSSDLNVFDSLQGHVEGEGLKKPCYLLAGTWYVFDKVFLDMLNNEFKELSAKSKNLSEQIKQRFGFQKKYTGETDFNTSLKKYPDILLTDKVLINYVELSDAIFWDKDNLYLMCNKSNFTGSGARDLYGQISIASQFLSRNIEANSYSMIESYYSLICKSYGVNELERITKKDFVELFMTRKICFIACFIDGFKGASRSQYAKYLTINSVRSLASSDYDFIPMGINE